MSNLIILDEINTNGMNFNILTIISFVSIFCGISVIISKNPIVSVLFLIGLFTTIAGYLMMLGINFIGLSYLLVYVGAVSILFLFILMLINVRISELVTENNNSVPLAIIITLLVSVNQFYPKIINIPSIATKTTNFDIELHTSGKNHMDEILTTVYSCWDEKLSETFHITTIGNIIYTNYPMWLILTSIILLLGMIGSILITIKN